MENVGMVVLFVSVFLLAMIMSFMCLLQSRPPRKQYNELGYTLVVGPKGGPIVICLDRKVLRRDKNLKRMLRHFLDQAELIVLEKPNQVIEVQMAFEDDTLAEEMSSVFNRDVDMEGVTISAIRMLSTWNVVITNLQVPANPHRPEPILLKRIA